MISDLSGQSKYLGIETMRPIKKRKKKNATHAIAMKKAIENKRLATKQANLKNK